MYDLNFVRHCHWTYEVFANQHITGSYSKRFEKFTMTKNCLPYYQWLEEKPVTDWVSLRVEELEDKSKNSDFKDLDVELSDCYYYSTSRRLRRLQDVLAFDECPYLKWDRPPNLSSGTCLSCEVKSHLCPIKA